MILFATISLLELVSSECYTSNGLPASDDYAQCQDFDFCCKVTDTCSPTTGLCQDINNHGNGSLTTLDGGQFNFTGLFQSVACINKDYSGCNDQCLFGSDNTAGYIWACNDDLTEFCCNNGNPGLEIFRGCCVEGRTFRLESTTTSTSSSTLAPTSTADMATLTASISTTASSHSPSDTANTDPPGNGPYQSGSNLATILGTSISIPIAVAGLVVSLLTYRHKQRKRRRLSALSDQAPTQHENPLIEASEYGRLARETRRQNFVMRIVHMTELRT
ncbi:hypothetical protein AC578_6833 [Pseudocercospora eumusae]|uniref:Mid2 domain-containing protein n=1 Tax=Pseudocercospora eumusae TaxID=321146 RepID=A0A139H799_9PEZI|nr:hypothetical protein AC578_6833 [Pseudocercospora eumusae]